MCLSKAWLVGRNKIYGKITALGMDMLEFANRLIKKVYSVEEL
jgi:hypothetical protein